MANRVEAKSGLNLTQLIAIVIKDRQMAKLKLNKVTLRDTISRTTGIQSTERYTSSVLVEDDWERIYQITVMIQEII